MEYRDLGIADAIHGRMRAHIVRVKQGGDTHDLHTTGFHKHECDFQMFYVLKRMVHPRCRWSTCRRQQQRTEQRQ